LDPAEDLLRGVVRPGRVLAGRQESGVPDLLIYESHEFRADIDPTLMDPELGHSPAVREPVDLMLGRIDPESEVIQDLAY
jgi:hypothetical protein